MYSNKLPFNTDQFNLDQKLMALQAAVGIVDKPLIPIESMNNEARLLLELEEYLVALKRTAAMVLQAAISF